MNNLIFAATDASNVPSVTNWNIYSWIIDRFSLGSTDTAAYLMVLGVLLCIIIPYLIGSINPAIIFSNKIYHDDIRTHGSGNAGTTNTLRTYGKKMAALILLLDFLKAVISVVVGALLMSVERGGAIAGIFVILGHSFPVYYKFRGGKGVACLAGVILMLSPISFVILLLLFIAIVLMTRFVSLGSIMCSMLLPLLGKAFANRGFIPFACIMIMVIIVFMHRENIKRLLAGKESKLSFGDKKKKNKAETETDVLPEPISKENDDDREA